MKVNDAWVGNYGGASYGKVDLIRATKLSINTAYVRLNSEIGMEATRQVAISAGYSKDTVGLDKNSIVGVLGTSSPHNYEIAEAYTTFATGGVRRPAHIIAKITDSAGNILYEAETQGTRQFEEENISELTKALAAVTESGGTGATAGKLGRPVAAKLVLQMITVRHNLWGMFRKWSLRSLYIRWVRTVPNNRLPHSGESEK